LLLLRALATAALACTTVLAQAPRLATGLKAPFTFAAFGDTRFTDPSDHGAANPLARQLMVKGIADSHPAFIVIGGDIAYNGQNPGDWAVYDQETLPWRQAAIPVYPILGNHDLHGKEAEALANYFQRFPHLGGARFYSVRAERTLVLALDSSLDELGGPQGAWLKGQLDGLEPDVDFVFLVLHHPPVTSSTDAKLLGGGHAVRPAEKELARMLEERQAHTRARFIVLASHVHNYDRHEQGHVVYFVTGGGGAHAYPIERQPGDPFQDKRVNYHFLQIRIEKGSATITMRRLGLETATPAWTTEDTVRIMTPGS